MILIPPKSTRTDTLLPYTTLSRSGPFDRSEVHTAQSQLDARDLARRSRHLFRRPLPSMERQRPDRRPVVGSAGASRHRWRVRKGGRTLRDGPPLPGGGARHGWSGLAAGGRRGRPAAGAYARATALDRKRLV